MKLQGKHYRTIWLDEANPRIVRTFDQRYFPFQIVEEALYTCEDAAVAIEAGRSDDWRNGSLRYLLGHAGCPRS
jgi:hypothetical protein